MKEAVLNEFLFNLNPFYPVRVTEQENDEEEEEEEDRQTFCYGREGQLIVLISGRCLNNNGEGGSVTLKDVRALYRVLLDFKKDTYEVYDEEEGCVKSYNRTCNRVLLFDDSFLNDLLGLYDPDHEVDVMIQAFVEALSCCVRQSFKDLLLTVPTSMWDAFFQLIKTDPFLCTDVHGDPSSNETDPEVATKFLTTTVTRQGELSLFTPRSVYERVKYELMKHHISLLEQNKKRREAEEQQVVVVPRKQSSRKRRRVA